MVGKPFLLYRGLGQLMVNSIGRRDYYVIQSIVLLIAVFNVLVTMLI